MRFWFFLIIAGLAFRFDILCADAAKPAGPPKPARKVGPSAPKKNTAPATDSTPKPALVAPTATITPAPEVVDAAPPVASSSKQEEAKPADNENLSGTAYNLEKCLNLALQQNTKIRSAQIDIEKSKGVIMQAKASLYPRITANATVAERNDDPFLQTKDKKDSEFYSDWGVSLVVRQSIYSGGVNRQRIAIAKLESESAFYQLQAVMNQVLYDVKQEFYNVLLKRAEIETKKKTIELYKQEHVRQKNMFEAGKSTKFSILRIEVNRANEEAGLIRLEYDLLNSMIRLSELIGTAWDGKSEKPPFIVEGQLQCPPTRLEVDRLVRLAMARRPDLRVFDYRADVAGRQVKIEKASNLPRLDLYAAISGSNDRGKEGFFDSRQDVSSGIQGRWDIFDAWMGKGKAMEQQAIQKKAEVDKQDVIRGIEQEVRTACSNLEESTRTMKAQKENVARAEESLKLSQLNLETGFGTLLDVLQATVDLSTSRVVETQARHRYLLSLAQLERAISLKVSDWDSGDQLGNDKKTNP